jgi:hypothetical protein
MARTKLAREGRPGPPCVAEVRTGLGGGATVMNGSSVQSGYHVLQNGPNGETGWRATFDVSNPFGTTFTLTVYAICATAS